MPDNQGAMGVLDAIPEFQSFHCFSPNQYQTIVAKSCSPQHVKSVGYSDWLAMCRAQDDWRAEFPNWAPTRLAPLVRAAAIYPEDYTDLVLTNMCLVAHPFHA